VKGAESVVELSAKPATPSKLSIATINALRIFTSQYVFWFELLKNLKQSKSQVGIFVKFVFPNSNVFSAFIRHNPQFHFNLSYSHTCLTAFITS
jgi:hypothetical protein